MNTDAVCLKATFFFWALHSLFSDTDNIAEWERELQQELNEYEVVDDGTQDLDDADLENEILQQIEAEAKQS